MKVLIYSHFFYPSIGGAETVSLALAEGFQNRGIQCKVITTTADEGNQRFYFDIIRNPKIKHQSELIKWADIVLFNGASLALQPWVIFHRKPFVWIHIGYQVSNLDGLGWVDGIKAPLSPLASLKFHIKHTGVVWALKEGFKLFIRRFVAKYLVTKNIAITKWMSKIQPLPRQIQIYNPFPLDQFQSVDNQLTEYDFVYLGRLVSEKGVATLLYAFAQVLRQQKTNLIIIGDGFWKQKLEELAETLDIKDFVFFAGKKSGTDLLNSISKAKIAVVPSEWYEPMGGVALEMMAAGKNVIVSEFGGLKECVEDAGLIFENGNSQELANCMIQLLNSPYLQDEQLIKAKDRVKLFSPEILIEKYISLLENLIKK